MSDIEQKRAWVAAHWPSAKWRKKVKKMPDAQVIAIYMREHGKAQDTTSKESKDDDKSGGDIPF